MKTNVEGITSMLPYERMDYSARKLRQTYAITPGAPIFHKEFGYYCLDQWYEQGLDRDVDMSEIFGYDQPGHYRLAGLGGTFASFCPAFEEKVLEDRGEHELVQDRAGRDVLMFKGKRNGFMPEYVGHPVKDFKSWETDCKWRMDPDSPERLPWLNKLKNGAIEAAGRGHMISQVIVGGYMYLRSLIGPEELLYAFYDMPELIHDCMQAWLKLADGVTAWLQQDVTYDEILLDEDICYNHGSLCSPEMMKEFLFPYYQQLFTNIRSRQLDKSRHLYAHIGTDGNVNPIIDVYRDAVGMDVLSPFEVASGCDVVEVGRKYPDLVISGGIDKRELAKGPDAIDRMLERIIPPMRERGGYIPTCDHGVPAEVTLENYSYYRKRMAELGG